MLDAGEGEAEIATSSRHYRREPQFFGPVVGDGEEAGVLWLPTRAADVVVAADHFKGKTGSDRDRGPESATWILPSGGGASGS
jgi:hypothetical protein